MIENEVDLIIIEGMGRTLHTNLNSHFKCDSTLKLAVIKVSLINEILNLLNNFEINSQNNYLASRLGGTIFDAICKFENQ